MLTCLHSSTSDLDNRAACRGGVPTADRSPAMRTSPLQMTLTLNLAE